MNISLLLTWGLPPTLYFYKVGAFCPITHEGMEGENEPINYQYTYKEVSAVENRKNLRFFIIMTYVAFYLLLGICALLMAIGLSMELISKYAPIFCSWASFIVLMIWAGKLMPGITRKNFIKGLFRERLECKWVLISIAIPVVAFVIVVLVLSKALNIPVGEMLNTDVSSYPMLVLLELLAGPTGEEPGWRGYYLLNSAKSRGILKSTMMTGVLWGFWHFPLWLMEGLEPIMFIGYVVSFLVAVISFNVILCYIFTGHRNLIYCVIIHLLFNFLGNLLKLDANGFVIYMFGCAICYGIIAALVLLAWRRKPGVFDRNLSIKGPGTQTHNR